MTDKTKRRKLEQTDKSSILKSLCREKGGSCSVSSQNSRFFDHLFQEEIYIKYSPELISSLSIRWLVTWPGGGGAGGRGWRGGVQRAQTKVQRARSHGCTANWPGRSYFSPGQSQQRWVIFLDLQVRASRRLTLCLVHKDLLSPAKSTSTLPLGGFV